MLREASGGANAVGEQLAAQLDGARTSLHRTLNESEESRKRVLQAVEELQKQFHSIAEHRATGDRLEHVLEELRPWEALLLQAETDAAGLPLPVARMVDFLNAGIGHDLSRLSNTLREFAGRVEQLSPVDSSDVRTRTVCRSKASAAGETAQESPPARRSPSAVTSIVTLPPATEAGAKQGQERI
jgi:hypothetical protein